MNDIGSEDGVLVEWALLLCIIEEAGGMKAVVLLLVEIDMQTSAVANFDRPLDIVYNVFDRLIILQLIYELDKRRRIGVVWVHVRLLLSVAFSFEWPRKRDFYWTYQHGAIPIRLDEDVSRKRVL